MARCTFSSIKRPSGARSTDCGCGSCGLVMPDMIASSPYAALTLLRGETHLHTLHSDGADTVADMLAACARAGYDFAVLTDHSTTSGAAELRGEHGLITLLGTE